MLALLHATAAAGAACTGFGCALLNLDSGLLKGNAWADGNEFLGIPFGAAERFSPPVVSELLPTTPLDATRIARKGGAACMRPGPPYTPGPGKAYGVEECLLLNLYTPPDDAPTSNDGGSRPILLWIFDSDVDGLIAFNGTKLAGHQNAIVAAVNHRLGPLGFAAFPGDELKSSLHVPSCTI